MALSNLDKYLARSQLYKDFVSKAGDIATSKRYFVQKNLLDDLRKAVLKAELPRDVFEKEQKFISEQTQLITEALKKLGISINGL